MKRLDKIILGLLAAGLIFLSYRAGSACAGGRACLALLPFAKQSAVQPVAHSSASKKEAPAWELKNLDGQPVKLSDFRGKVVLLNFWATWCPPCRREIPEFFDLQKSYGDKGLVIVGVAMDEGGTKVVKPFVSRLGINYPVVIGDAETASAYGGIEALPTTFVIDQNGQIITEQEGGADRSTFEAEIKALLQK